MYLQSTCIKAMEYSNITLFNNRYKDQLITVENDYLYPLCLFQFMKSRNTAVTASPMHYSVNVLDNSYYRLSQSIQILMCLFLSTISPLTASGYQMEHFVTTILKQYISKL